VEEAQAMITLDEVRDFGNRWFNTVQLALQLRQSTMDRSRGKTFSEYVGGTRGVSVNGDPVASARSKSAVPASSTAVTKKASKTYGMPFEASPEGAFIIWK
jgi:hypothetical protein